MRWIRTHGARLCGGGIDERGECGERGEVFGIFYSKHFTVDVYRWKLRKFECWAMWSVGVWLTLRVGRLQIQARGR